MKFGLALPQYDFSIPGRPIEWSLTASWAQRAESLGFDSVWISDHLFLDLARYGGSGERVSALECFTTLAGLAGVTTRVRLGTLVLCNDLRSPSLVAKMAAAIDLSSNGRLELGIGAGWYEAEYRAAGVPFERPGIRIARMAEALQIIAGMLTEEAFSFEGRYYQVTDAVNLPRPVQSPRPPIWVGGKGDRVVSVAGKLADGFNTVWAWTPETYAGRVRVLESAAESAGRDPKTIRRSVGLYCLPGSDSADIESRWARYVDGSAPGIGSHDGLPEWRGDKLCGTPEEITDRLGQFEALGVEEVILSFGILPFQIADEEAVEFFARELISGKEK